MAAYASCLNRDSIVVVIGDARNNRYEPETEIIRKISRLVRKCYWLNTEEKVRWDKDDSVIGKYAPYLTEVYEMVKVEDGEIIFIWSWIL